MLSLFIFSLGIAPVVLAQQEGEPPRPGEMSQSDAVSLAIARNRDLIAARLEIAAAQVEQIAASMLPNPELGYSMENIVLGAGNPQEIDLKPRPFSQLIQSVELTQVLDVWFKRGLRRRAADMGVEVARLLLRDVLREVRYAVQSAFAEVVREQWESELASQIRARYDSTVALSRKRCDAGEISQSELRKIELETLKYVNEEINAKMELAIARRHLAALLAFDAETQLPARLADNDLDAPVESEAELLVRAGSQRPDKLAMEATVQQATAATDAARRAAYPDLTAGVGYSRSYFQISGDNPHTLSLNIAVELPVFSRNQAEIAAAQVQYSRAENDLRRLELEIARDVGDAAQRMHRSHAMLQIFRDEMLKRAEQALAVTENSYRAGAMSLLDILEAQRTYIETRATYLETKYLWRQALIDMVHATGSEL